MQRTIIKTHKATAAHMDDLVTYRALPVAGMPMDRLDPFIFLNHHGPQVYPANNRGLPFGPHPHRGFETVTFILEGDLMHKDNNGHSSTIKAGGIQWMTAGRGIIHSEVSSPEFLKSGGKLEMLQLWLNLPSKFKMTEPHYVGLQSEDIPEIYIDNNKITLHAVSGEWNGTKAPIQSLTDVHLAFIDFREGGQFHMDIAEDRNIFLYIVSGEMEVNGKDVSSLNIVEFSHEGENVSLHAKKDAVILFGHALPYNEPIVPYGPFVMNSMDEIKQAYSDYQEGAFGNWNE